MSAPAGRTIRGEVLTRDHLPTYAEDGDAYIVVADAAIAERRGSTWVTRRGDDVAAEIDRTRARWYAALRDDDYDPLPYEIVEDLWPYDGPYSRGTTAAAATALAALTRYLNNATQKPSGLPNAPTIGEVLGGLTATMYGLDQMLGQLAAAADHQAQDPTLYDDRAPAGQGGDLARELAAELRLAVRDTLAARQRIQHAAQLASRLGHRSTT